MDADDLAGRIREPFESKDVDYKGPVVWDEGNKEACCKIVKDILAMANTLGGFLIIGVAEKNRRFYPVGLSDEQVTTFESSQINRFLNNYAEPPINVTLRNVDVDNRTYVIIQIPVFPVTPHICVKDYPDVLTAPTLYVRTDNNESAPLQKSSDFNLLIERAVRNRADTLLSSIHTVLTGQGKPISPTAEEQYAPQLAAARERFGATNPLPQKGYSRFRETYFQLSSFDPNRFRLSDLRPAAHAASVSYRGWPFLFYNQGKNAPVTLQDCIEFLLAEAYAGSADWELWRLHTSGFFYHKRVMWEDTVRRRLAPGVTGVNLTLFHLAEAFDCLVRLYMALDVDPDETVKATVSLIGGQGSKLVVEDPHKVPLRGDYSCHIDPIIETVDVPLVVWRSSLIDKTVEAMENICLKFNWLEPNIAQFRKDVEALFQRKL